MSWGSCPSHLSSSLVGIESVESPSFSSQLTRSDDRSCSLMYPGMLELYARSRDTFLRRCLSEPDDSALLSLTMCRSVYPVEASLSLDQSSSSDSAPESLLSEYGCSAAWLSLNSELSSTVAGIPAVLREGCVPAKEASSETLFARAVRLSRPPPWRLSVDLVSFRLRDLMLESMSRDACRLSNLACHAAHCCLSFWTCARSRTTSPCQ
mmetsp:Transcript_1194/g.5058  ORF Transcript_1194/g.5058 Transcript_1194/m.5058 type:complete len:209 (+) Transcript_1194:559-1185(+)